MIRKLVRGFECETTRTSESGYFYTHFVPEGRYLLQNPTTQKGRWGRGFFQREKTRTPVFSPQVLETPLEGTTTRSGTSGGGLGWSLEHGRLHALNTFKCDAGYALRVKTFSTALALVNTYMLTFIVTLSFRLLVRARALIRPKRAPIGACV